MLKQRVITALVLVAVLSLILFLLPSVYAVAAFAGLAAVAAWEWSRLLQRSQRPSGARHILFPLCVLACCVLLRLYSQWQLPLCLIAAGFWLLVPLWLVRRWPLPNGIGGYLIGVIVIVPAWIGMVQLQARGPWALLAAMVLVWVADIAAYFVGRAIGRHKLAPAISPGKTWEGVAGAAAGGLLYVFLLREYAGIASSINTVLVVLGTVVLVVISIVGDLFESMIKRQAGVKDSSQLLPGHGGVLDRIDSLTSTLPLLAVAIGFQLL